MASQNAKFIDVTKTYLPVDPNSFPESMHGTGQEDNPESRIPASAYEGHNFLPTSYGYKSYFGTNQKLGIDNLTVRVDHLMVFQTETFENLMIALTEEGIFIRNAATAGAWTQAKVLPAPALDGVHFNWSFVVISDVLYCYQAGQPSYQKIVSSATAPFYTLTDVVPNFLNMAGQVGIFSAGGRLGFWDTADSIGWSNQDDFADFTPSLETLAGNSTFSDVNGRIVTARPHGKGFMVYATKSIVYIQENAESTYQWEPQVVLSNSGIAYPTDVTVAVPDTEHYAYTNTGLYKVEKAKATLIVPEVTDFLQKAAGPKYPRVVQGRYLFISLLDRDYLDGQVNFTDEEVPGLSYYFPGSQTLAQASEDFTIRGNNICSIFDGMNNASFPEQQTPGGTTAGGVALPGKKPNTLAQPIWTCYISNRAGNPDDITWTNTPCATTNLDGVEQNMSPAGTGHRLDATTTGTGGKTPLLGSDLYVDGKWTMERFLSVQTAIWKKEQEELNAYIAKITNRAKYQEKTSTNTVCADSFTKSECTIGDYVTEYSEPQFGYSACSFWLTRFATRAGTLKVKKTVRKVCTFNPLAMLPGTVMWNNGAGGPYIYSTPTLACKSIIGGSTWFAEPEPFPPPPTPQETSCWIPPHSSAGHLVGGLVVCPAGSSNVGGGTWPNVCQRDAYYDISDRFAAYNEMEYKEIGDAVPETAYCVITGWKYEKVDGTFATVAAASCTQPTQVGSGGNPAAGAGASAKKNRGPRTPISNGSGSICSIPFQDVTIPGTPSMPVTWPDEEVAFPSGSFLLQKGSIGPIYPEFEGAIVYDLQLKKWGKYQDRYKQLLDYQPLNDQSGGGIPYTRFGMLAGVLKTGGGIYLFDDAPEDSRITYGKIGYYRLGMTSAEEARADFAEPFTGQLRLNSSMDGRIIATNLEKVGNYENVRTAVLQGGYSARWHNISILGRFDLTYLEFRGFTNGKR